LTGAIYDPRRLSLDARRRGGKLGVVLVFMTQFGTAHLRESRGNPFDALLALLVAICAGAIVFLVIQFVVLRSQRGLRSWRGARRRQRAAANAERRARALMSELCPHGWRAQITLFEGEPPDHEPAPPARVALDWTELERGSGRPLVVRRVWARTIAEALEAMVADRRTDETLEQIEQGAAADGNLWPDLS
jgi:hypothetical protein